MSWCRTTPTCCERWACSHPPGTGTRPGRLLSVRCRPQNAEVTKQVTVARQAQGDVEREKKELEDSFQRVSEQSQRKVSRVRGGDGDPCLHTGTWAWRWVGTPQGLAQGDLSPAHSPRSRRRC